MATLFEIISKKHSAPEGGEHRKSEHKGGKEHRKEKSGDSKEHHKEKSKPKYPEMKLEDVASKIAGGYKFKSATDDDYKDKEKEKNIVSIKLPKMGLIPFVMIPPPDAGGEKKTHKPMDIKGDPSPKDKVESADKHPAQQWYKENFNKFKLHGIDVKKDGIIELDHGDSDTENSDKSFKDHMKNNGYEVKTTMGNPKKDNKIMYKVKQNKSKVESEFDPKSLKNKFAELGAHHLKALTTNKKEDHMEYHKHAKKLKEDIEASEKETPDRKSFHGNMKNAIRSMDSLHKVDEKGEEKKPNTK